MRRGLISIVCSALWPWGSWRKLVSAVCQFLRTSSGTSSSLAGASAARGGRGLLARLAVALEAG